MHLTLDTVSAWAQSHPALTTTLAVAIVAWWLVARSRAKFVPQLDPVRLFTATQKADALARCGRQCEAESPWLVRCHRTATQGDHWYPHSKGGTTNDANLAMLCGPCNNRKSARIPSWLETARLAHRRSSYAPGLGRPGERFHR